MVAAFINVDDVVAVVHYFNFIRLCALSVANKFIVLFVQNSIVHIICNVWIIRCLLINPCPANLAAQLNHAFSHFSEPEVNSAS